MHRGLKFDFRNRSTRSKKYEAAEATNEKKTRKTLTHKSVEKKNERIKKWLHYCANQCSLHCMVLLVKVNAIRFTAHEMYAEWFSLGTRINCANIFELRQCIIIKRQIEYRNAIISDRASHIKCRPQNTTHRINAIPFPPNLDQNIGKWAIWPMQSQSTRLHRIKNAESKLCAKSFWKRQPMHKPKTIETTRTLAIWLLCQREWGALKSMATAIIEMDLWRH